MMVMVLGRGKKPVRGAVLPDGALDEYKTEAEAAVNVHNYVRNFQMELKFKNARMSGKILRSTARRRSDNEIHLCVPYIHSRVRNEWENFHWKKNSIKLKKKTGKGNRK